MDRQAGSPARRPTADDAHAFEAPPSAVRLENGQVVVSGDPEQRVPLRHVAGLAHWNQTMLPPGMEPGLRVTHVFNLPTARPPDEHDRVNSQNIYGFVADVVVVEIDRDTGASLAKDRCVLDCP